VKNVLVIGGSYFVGRVFVEELRARGGHAIHVLNRGRKPLGLDGVHEIACDRHDTEALRRLVPALDWHAVIDFCAYRPEEVAGLLENLPGSVRRYVLISTATVLQASRELPMSEDSPRLSEPLPGPGGDYGYLKRLAEDEAERTCRARGIEYVGLRPTFIYGAHNYAPRESYFFELAQKGETILVPEAPQALFSMVSVWDVARVCISSLDDDGVCGGSWIVTSDELVCYDRLLDVLAGLVGAALDVQHKPVRILETRGVPLPFPLTEHLAYSGARLRNLLSFSYTPLAEGLARTYDWYREQRAAR
jgi:nucleoside-diphosphate-sugar epimerase